MLIKRVSLNFILMFLALNMLHLYIIYLTVVIIFLLAHITVKRFRARFREKLG